MNDPERIARLRISLKEIEPEIWRRVDVPLGMNLKGLHEVVQAVMGWQDNHLFEFRVGDKLYSIPAPDDDYGRKVLHAKLAKIEALVARGTTRFDYVYDFGDDWQHLIEIETIAEGDPATNALRRRRTTWTTGRCWRRPRLPRLPRGHHQPAPPRAPADAEMVRPPLRSR
jgi:hypothetical protein